MLRDIPYFEETKQFSIMLPNNYNFGFYFPYMLRVYLLFGFFPILYTTMNYMYQLRCKRLNIKQHRLNRPKKEDWNKSTFEIKKWIFQENNLTEKVWIYLHWRPPSDNLMKLDCRLGTK